MYKGGEPGSPIIALQSLLEHRDFAHLACEFVFMFMEPDPERFNSLKTELSKFEIGRKGLPGNVKVDAINSSFEEAAGGVLEALEAQKKKIAPTFAFIDPFGFSGLPIELICRLLSFKKCEVFVNFMIDWVNRFVAHPDQQQNFASLFGTDEYAVATALTGAARSEFLSNLYKKQLRDLCGFAYVTSFEMIHDGGHTGNLLVYGTRSLDGLRVMKDAMWRVDPQGGVTFADRFAGHEVMFSGRNVDLEPLKAIVLDTFGGQRVPVERIREFVLAETPYADSHWNRPLLAPFERQGVLKVVSSPRSKRFTFPPGTIVQFP